VTEIARCHDCGLSSLELGVTLVTNGGVLLCDSCAQWMSAHPPEPPKLPKRRSPNHNAAHTNLVNAILMALAKLPPTDCVCWPNQVGAARTDTGRFIEFGLFPGSADIIACVRGRFVGLEAKTGSGRINESQERWHGNVSTAGGIAVVVRSVEDAMRVVDGVRRQHAA
jgi:hypothetical protein